MCDVVGVEVCVNVRGYVADIDDENVSLPEEDLSYVNEVDTLRANENVHDGEGDRVSDLEDVEVSLRDSDFDKDKVPRVGVIRTVRPVRVSLPVGENDRLISPENVNERVCGYVAVFDVVSVGERVSVKLNVAVVVNEADFVSVKVSEGVNEISDESVMLAVSVNDGEWSVTVRPADVDIVSDFENVNVCSEVGERPVSVTLADCDCEMENVEVGRSGERVKLSEELNDTDQSGVFVRTVLDTDSGVDIDKLSEGDLDSEGSYVGD